MIFDRLEHIIKKKDMEEIVYGQYCYGLWKLADCNRAIYYLGISTNPDYTGISKEILHFEFLFISWAIRYQLSKILLPIPIFLSIWYFGNEAAFHDGI